MRAPTHAKPYSLTADLEAIGLAGPPRHRRGLHVAEVSSADLDVQDAHR